MNRQPPPNCHPSARYWIRLALSVVSVALIASCAVPPQKTAGPTAQEISKQQRAERAQINLNEGLKKYDGGNNDAAIKDFLLALDSGQLALADQLKARKHIAFIHCLSGREANCKEEFEKIIAIDAKFDLAPAEAGHPTWGPIFRLARTEIELRRAGRALPAPIAKPISPGEKLMLEAMKAYDDADYNQAVKNFQDALKEPLADADKVAAHKFTAFSYCLTNRMTLCRTEFEAVFKIDPKFDLAPAEAGHPSWGPSFRAVKAKQKPVPPKK